MRVGISTPAVVRLPGIAEPWEAEAGPDDLAAIAAAADRLGYDHLTCSEHVAIPEEVAETRGATYYDPLATLSFLAAHTRRIRLVTQVLVLGYHHPLAIAKRFGTLDRLSGGRLVLGVGVGSLEEEFALLGAEFAGRGAQADDALKAITAAWGRRAPAYHGTHYDFDSMIVEPHAPRTHVPIWVGGRTRRSLRRAVELGDGWVPFGRSKSELAEMLTAGGRDDLEVVLDAGRPLDPIAEPERAVAGLQRAVDAGATTVGARLRADSATGYVEALHALAELVELEPPEPPEGA